MYSFLQIVLLDGVRRYNMFITFRKGDSLNRTINQFICENEEDLQEIPKNERIFGSIAYIINNKALYIANSEGEWKVV